MLSHGPLLRMRARRLTVRVGFAVVACSLAAGLLGTAGTFSSGVAQAKKGDKSLPPGQAKKLLPNGAAKSIDQTEPSKMPKAVRVPKAVKQPKASKAPHPPKAAKPSKAPKPPKSPPADSGPDTPQGPPSEGPRSSPAVATPQGPVMPTAAKPDADRPAGANTRRQRTRARRPSAGARPDQPSPPAGLGGDAADGGAGSQGSPNGPPVSSSRGASGKGDDAEPEESGSPVTRTVRDIVEVVPDSLKLALAALAALSLALAGGYVVSLLRARSLARQRSELLSEVGLLQGALLPPIPQQLGALKTTVAYRPADGPGAGGDFYDALPLSDGRVGFILGDVSGHGRGALERTAFMRYTLRAYLEAGLAPHLALQVAGRVIGDGLGGDFATVLLAVHDPRSGSLTYASAGHPAPIVLGDLPFEPVLAGSSPPIGVGEPTGLRETTVPLMPGAVACLYTDGLIEARTEEGLLGRERLEQVLAEMGPEATASDLLDRVAGEARTVSDDMATCILSPTARVTTGGFRTERIELSRRELEGPLPGRFLDECGVSSEDRKRAMREARDLAGRFEGVVLRVAFGNRRAVEVRPRNVESIEAAAQRAAAGA